MPRILVIDDDAAISELVAVNLEMAGYDVSQAEDGIKGQALALQLQPDLIMLDLMLPRVDGFTVCQRLRRDDRTAEIPVLMLTALSQTQNKVEGFNAGADDYILKPYRAEDFLKLIRLYLKPDIEATEQLRFGDLVLDIGTRRAIYKNKAIDLTMKEFELLKFLMEHPREVLTRDKILENVWGYNFMGESNVIEVYIRYLRIKIEEEGQKRLIQTVRGVGYVLRDS